MTFLYYLCLQHLFIIFQNLYNMLSLPTSDILWFNMLILYTKYVLKFDHILM